MSEDEMDRVTRLLKDRYHPPPPVPREEMWAVIRAGMEETGGPPASLEAARLRRGVLPWRRMGWAAAAVIVLGIGVSIGRVTAPVAGPAALVPVPADEALVRLAAVEHLGRTESLLRLARADGREGRIDPGMASWGRDLLTQTRLLLDSTEGGDPAMKELLEDLELVLMQIVAVSEQGGDEGRARSELLLALDGLEQREVLQRIQAVMPSGAPLAGT